MSPEPTRRQALGLAGGALCAGVLAACSGGSGGGHESTPPGTLSQWYHQYSEQGAHAAVKRYAAAYPRGTVHVRWVDGNYDQKAADAPMCLTCGTKMRPAGSCYVCEGCGSTSGCS